MTGLSWEDDGAQEGLLTRRSAQNCLTEHELEEFLFNRLSGVTREVIEEHLLACEHCQERAESESEYFGAFQHAAKQIEAEDFELDSPAASMPAWKVFLLGRRTLVALVPVSFVAVGLFYSYSPHRIEAAVELSLARGAAEIGVSAPAGRDLRLNADVSELPPLPRWKVDVVSATGETEQSAEVAPTGGRLRWQVKGGLSAGRHWVRLRDPGSGSLVREFGLVVR